MSKNQAKSEIKSLYRWQPPVLDDQGREVVSPVTLVSVADLRPVSMAERVRRYMRLPQFVEDQKALQDLWSDDDFDENLDLDDTPMSPYEDRAREVAVRVQTRKAKEAAEAAEKKAEEDRKKYEEWSAHYEKLRQKSSAPPTTEKNDSPPPQNEE